jgi:hypothetical protein
MVFSSHILFSTFSFSLLLYYAAPRSSNAGPHADELRVLRLDQPWFVLLILWATLVDFCCGNLIYGHWQLIGP